MTDAYQPVAGSLSAVVQRACREESCPHYQTVECPDHATTQDLGTVAGFDYRNFDNRKEPASGKDN